MEEEMEVLYVEGLATHGGPQPWVGAPGGRGKALDGGGCGRGYRAAKSESGVLTLSVRGKAPSSAALSRAASGRRPVVEGICAAVLPVCPSVRKAPLPRSHSCAAWPGIDRRHEPSPCLPHLLIRCPLGADRAD